MVFPLFEGHGSGGGDESAGDKGKGELHGGDGRQELEVEISPGSPVLYTSQCRLLDFATA